MSRRRPLRRPAWASSAATKQCGMSVAAVCARAEFVWEMTCIRIWRAIAWADGFIDLLTPGSQVSNVIHHCG